MSAFLERLAGMAIGDPVPGAAVADLPPRFGARPSGPVEATVGSPEAPAAAYRGETPPYGRPALVTRASSDPAGPPAARREPGTPPYSSPLIMPAEASVVWGFAPPREAADDPPGRPSPEAREFGELPGEPPSLMVAATPAASSVSVTVVRSDEPATSTRAVQAPLSEAALASRAAPPRTPVVHVTIDRLEVRAPVAGRPPAAEAPARRRPQPSVSLAEFLRAGDERGRR